MHKSALGTGLTLPRQGRASAFGGTAGVSLDQRREFITLLGGAAVAWPLSAFAQQRTIPVVGFLGPALDTRLPWLAAFRRGLGAEGFVDGQNVTIEYRSADDGAGELPELAAMLAQRQVAVIFASGPPAALAAKRSTPTIPIVFVSGGDPARVSIWHTRDFPAARRPMFGSPGGLDSSRTRAYSRVCPEAESGAPSYSITSSARASRVGGTSMPSAFAVLRLITSSYLVGFCTGRSTGFSPLRMRSTYSAERRYVSAGSGP